MKRSVDFLAEELKATIEKLERKTKLSADEKEEMRLAKMFYVAQPMTMAAGAGR